MKLRNSNTHSGRLKTLMNIRTSLGELGRATLASFFYSSRRQHTIYIGDWSSDVCSSDLSVGLIAGAATSLFGSSGKVQAESAVAARNVVLVHGAYADGSCWSEVIGRLQLAGLRSTAVQIGRASC